jgi:hypothetical protein
VLDVVESGGAIGRRGAAVTRRICISKHIILLLVLIVTAMDGQGDG